MCPIGSPPVLEKALNRRAGRKIEGREKPVDPETQGGGAREMLTKLYARVQSSIASDEGATAVEYGIMVAAIAAVIVALVFLIGGEVKEAFQKVYDELVKPH